MPPTNQSFTVEGLSHDLRLFNLADPTCENCHGRGQRGTLACPCTQASAPEVPTPGRAHRGGHDTEHLAARSVASSAAVLRRRVLSELFDAADEGCTDEELAHRINHPHPHSCGTRRKELSDAGWPIIDSGRRRRTRSLRTAIVWILRPEGRQQAVVALAQGGDPEAIR